MAGKQEHKPGVVIDYKEKLDDRFVDISTQKTTPESNAYLTQFNTKLNSENTQTIGSVSPYYYYSKVRPGAKSPLSVEMAQHIFKNTLEAVEDALRAEIARAYSSEKYLSDFMKENMVTKSEDQTISGFKKFDSTQTEHADIDTAKIDEATINDLYATNVDFDNLRTRYLHVTEDADIDRDATIGRDLKVERDVSIDRNLDVDGTAQIDGDTTIGNDKFKVSSADGNTTIEGTLDVTRATHLKSTLQVDENATLKKNLQVDKNTNLDGTLDITGATHLKSTVQIDGKADLKGALDVTGATHLKSTAQIDGNTTITTMQASGKVDLNASDNTADGLSVTNLTATNLTVTRRLKIPLSRPSNPQPGEIWYEG